jgi:potassium channel LctB
VRDYAGGMKDWEESGHPVAAPPALPVIRASSGVSSGRNGTPRSRRRLGALSDRLLEQFSIRSTGWLMTFWTVMIFLFGGAYWLLALAGIRLLSEGGRPVEGDAHGFATAIYFSFVTATSIGFGDVVPLGVARVMAVAEAAAGLLVFGCIISKLVSNRQEMLIEETHRIAFEDRLGRVRTNLHLVLSDLQGVRTGCRSAPDGSIPPSALPRIESVAMVFAGELRTVHDLLYRPQQAPEEAVLEAILASLCSVMQELHDLLASAAATPAARASAPTLATSLRTIGRLSEEICGDCVPRAHGPALNVWMNRIQQIGRSLELG